MPDRERTSAQIILEEIRRQVDQQVTAADSADTKAMAIFGGAAAVAALIAPRATVVGSDGLRIAASIATLGLLVAALICLLRSVRPRIGGFSNGPNVKELAAGIDDDPAGLERDLVPAFVGVRTKNEAFLQSKAGWTIKAQLCLIGTVVGMAVMVAVGAVK